MSENKRLIRLLSSAGGGKTYRLSTRYKNLLKENNTNLKKTLAITFTNKAATEMKERILGLLKEEALKKNDKISRELIDYILDNYSDFSVRTIDSFVNSLVKAFSIELGITPEADLIMDSEYYKNFAVNSLIQSVEEDRDLRERLLNFIVKRIEIGGRISWNFRRTLRDGMDRLENYENNENVVFEPPPENLSEMDLLQAFSDQLARDSSIKDWQLQQAMRAVELYLNVYLPWKRDPQADMAGNEDLQRFLSDSQLALVQMKKLMELRHYSPKTRKTYAEWVERYFYYAEQQNLEWNSPDTVRA